jgi:hypothetical protein
LTADTPDSPAIDDLFGTPQRDHAAAEIAKPTAKPKRSPARQGVQPATVTPEVSALAQRLPRGLRIGTSSWSHRPRLLCADPAGGLRRLRGQCAG